MAGLLISCDVEASGPCPLHGDMISFGCVVIEPTFSWQFYSEIMKPECLRYSDAAYASIGMTRDAHHNLAYDTISTAMERFDRWCKNLKRTTEADRLIMVSDNPGFDFQWMNFECQNKIGYNPFGHSARRIGDAWGGLRNRYYETQGWKKLRRTKHTHNPLDDALGNAEAWLAMWELHGSKEAKKEIEKLRKKFQQISNDHSTLSGTLDDIPNSHKHDCGLADNWPRL